MNKTTVVWLLQEGERVLVDRLFRVRGDQTYSCKRPSAIAHVNSPIPVVCSTVHIGDICVFAESTKSWKIDRILKFAYYKRATKKLRQYCGVTASLSEDIGVLCMLLVCGF